MQTEPTAGVSIFVSSAPPDQTLQQELKEHLSPLQQEGRISLWVDTDSNARAEGEHDTTSGSIAESGTDSRLS